MEITTLWNFLGNYAGVIIGAVLLLLGTMALPSGLKRYVLTAGFAILAFRVAQIAHSKKRLAKADAERTRLRAEMQKSAAERDELIKKQNDLNNQAIKLKQGLSQLDAQSRTLDSSTAAAAKTKLDKEVEDMQARHAQLLRLTQSNEKILALFNNADEAIRDLERVQ